MEHSTMESCASGSGGPTKFIEKTYQMVNDPSNDAIVSWSHGNNSFIIKDHFEFSSKVLDKYFNYNTFSNFVRQLNAYGFRKISHDQYEYYNEYFRKDQYHLLSNIHRKEPVHSHSLGEAERLAFEKEIEKLSNEKASIELDIYNFRQNMSAKKLHVDNLVQRLEAAENRHNILKKSFEMVLQNPKLVEEMKNKIKFNFSLGFPNKKSSTDAAENHFVDHNTNFGLKGAGNS